MAKMLYFCIFFVTATLISNSSANKCIQKDPCTCQFDEYNLINLTMLALPTKFISDGEGNFTYFFSGCKDWDFIASNYGLNSTQNFTASLVKCVENIIPYTVIKNATTFNATYIEHKCSDIGHSKDIRYDSLDNTNYYQIVYNVKVGSSPSIQLVCDSLNHTDLKIANHESDMLTLYSPLVCIKHLTHHELSTGSIFCILFFTTAFIYFVGGGIIMYTARGARGVEVIPNFDFWVSLPGLMRDGMVYILSGCRPFTVATAETYDRI